NCDQPGAERYDRRLPGHAEGTIRQVIVQAGRQEASLERRSSERRFALILPIAVLLVNAVSLSAELTVGRVTGNDNISHWSLLQGMVRAVENGENPLDFWSPEASLGSPIMRTYQPLAHALVAVIYFALA